MGEWKDIDRPTMIYTEGLAPCIGLCIAWKGWAGMVHDGDLSPGDTIFKELIAKAKASIPPDRFVHIRPILCGGAMVEHEPEDGVDQAEYEADMLLARKTLVDALLAEGFDAPIERWSKKGEGAEIYADLEAGEIWLEIDWDKVATWKVQS